MIYYPIFQAIFYIGFMCYLPVYGSIYKADKDDISDMKFVFMLLVCLTPLSSAAYLIIFIKMQPQAQEIISSIFGSQRQESFSPSAESSSMSTPNILRKYQYDDDENKSNLSGGNKSMDNKVADKQFDEKHESVSSIDEFYMRQSSMARIDYYNAKNKQASKNVVNPLTKELTITSVTSNEKAHVVNQQQNIAANKRKDTGSLSHRVNSLIRAMLALKQEIDDQRDEEELYSVIDVNETQSEIDLGYVSSPNQSISSVGSMYSMYSVNQQHQQQRQLSGEVFEHQRRESSQSVDLNHLSVKAHASLNHADARLHDKNSVLATEEYTDHSSISMQNNASDESVAASSLQTTSSPLSTYIKTHSAV